MRKYLYMQAYNSETIKYKNEIQMILDRPGIFIGEIKQQIADILYYDFEKKIIHRKTSRISYGFLQCFIEIFINARDHMFNDQNCNQLDIKIDQKIISIKNNGNGLNTDKIFIENKEYYNPHCCFFKLRTSTNYDDDKQRFTGGMNGLGGKCTSIFSKNFQVETVFQKKDNTFIHYTQNSHDNISTVNDPEINILTHKSQQQTYTKIDFELDFPRFEMDQITDCDIEILTAYVLISAQSFQLFKKKYIVNLEVTHNKQKIFFQITPQTLQQFAKKYFMSDLQQIQYYQQQNWEVLVLFSLETQIQYCVTNSILNYFNGSHLDHIQKQISQILKTKFEQQNTEQDFKKQITRKINQYISNNFTIIVSCCIDKPSFDSQNKLKLTKSYKEFNPQFDLKQLQSIADNKQLITMINNSVQQQIDQQLLTQTDCNVKQKQHNQIQSDKYIPCQCKNPDQSYLIICEGNSASNFIISMLDGNNQNYGLLILKGKFINTRKNSVQKVAQNEEFKLLKRVLQLNNKQQEQKLRYNNIVIAADSDSDGFHITSLLVQLFDQYWSQIIQKGYVKFLQTSIVRIYDKQQKIQKEFYTFDEFKQYFLQNEQNIDKQLIYYSKGLGSNSQVYAKQILGNLNNQIIKFQYKNEGDRKLIDQMFNRYDSDARKDWLENQNQQYQQQLISNGQIFISDYLNTGLLQYSKDNQMRQIPNLIDGFKESQRKALYCGFLCLYKNGKPVKQTIQQFSGLIGTNLGYHHGQESLDKLICRMCNPLFNKINYFSGIGQFGNIKDNKSSQTRYISLTQSEIIELIFEKEFFHLLQTNSNEQFENNQHHTPEYFTPLLPMILVNGQQGISFGYSTNIPQININNLIQYILNSISGDNQIVDLIPDFADFKGKYYYQQNIYISEQGTEPKKIKNYFCVPDMNINMIQNSFQLFSLKPMQTYSKFLKNLKNQFDEEQQKKINIIGLPGQNTINIKIQVDTSLLDFQKIKLSDHQNLYPHEQISDQQKIQIVISEFFGLYYKINYDNMHCVDQENKIHKFSDMESILQIYVKEILKYQARKKEYIINEIEKQVDQLQMKLQFIQQIDKINLTGITKKQLHQFIQINCVNNLKNPTEKMIENVMNMNIYDLTTDRCEQLQQKTNDLLEELDQIKKKQPSDLWRDKLLLIQQKLQNYHIKKYEQKQI